MNKKLAAQMTVSDYSLVLNGHYIRQATQVTLADGTVIKFMERMSKKAAIANALYQASR